MKGERIGFGNCSSQCSALLQVLAVWTRLWVATNVLPVRPQLCQLTAEHTADTYLHTTARYAVKHLTSWNLRKRLGFVCETNFCTNKTSETFTCREEWLMQKPMLP